MAGVATAQASHRRSASLDGLRALAALSVLAFHVWLYRDDRPKSGRRPELLDAILFEANLGLVCFFVLSGYLLYRSFARAALAGGTRVATRRYAVRRAARILPAYYACLAGCLVLYALFGPHNITPTVGEMPLFLVLGQNYSGTTIMQLNPVTWTLVVEAAFYLLLPLLGLLVLRLAPRRAWAQVAMILVLIAISVAWNGLAYHHGWSPLVKKLLPGFLGAFGAGMLVAVWIEWRRIARPPREGGHDGLGPWATGALALLGALVVFGDGYWSETVDGGSDARAMFAMLMPAAGFALIVAAIAGGRGRAVHWLGWRPLAAVGLVSYGLYLWHLPLLLVLRGQGLLPQALWPRMLVVLVAALVAAALSWRYVEQPAMAWAARRERRRAPEPGPAQAAPVPPRQPVAEGAPS